jgi:hypothetical protein
MTKLPICFWVLVLLPSVVAFQGAAGEDKTNKSKAPSKPKASSKTTGTAAPRTAREFLAAGQRLYKAEKYSESVPYLVKAIELGEAVKLPVKHHHGGMNRTLCSGELTLRKGQLKFTSLNDPELDLPADKIIALKPELDKGGRLNAKLLVSQNNKEKREDYNFHVYLAEPSLTYPRCDHPHCPAALDVLYQLLGKVKQ